MIRWDAVWTVVIIIAIVIGVIVLHNHGVF
jgi:hypothetical protein